MPTFVRDLRGRYHNLARIASATFTTINHHGHATPAYRVGLIDSDAEIYVAESTFENAADTRAIVPAVELGYTVWTFDQDKGEPFELGPVIAWRIDDDATAYPIHTFGGEFDDRDVVRAPSGEFYRPGDQVIGDLAALRAYIGERRADEAREIAEARAEAAAAPAGAAP